MKILTLLASFALALLAPGGATAEPGPSFHFVLKDENDQLRGRQNRVAQQVVEIFGEMRIRTTWSSDPNDPFLRPTRSVIVVVLPHSSRDMEMAAGVLGAVVGEAESRRSVFVFYPDVERALGLRPVRAQSILGGGWPVVRWQRAIARVIAHEILHYFLPGRPHDASGLFMEDLSGSSLIRPSLGASEETKKAFVESLLRLERR